LKKRSAILLCAVVLALVFLPFLTHTTEAQTITLKVVTAWPKNTTDNKSLFYFMESVEQQVAKKYPGELKLNLVGGPEAVKIQDQVHAAQTGMVDIVHTTNAYYVSILPEVDAMKLSDFKPWEERANGAWAYFNDLHEKKGLYLLGRIGIDMPFYLYLSRPIKAADLKGFNIRVSPMYLQVIKGLGGNPVVIPPTDVYQALERKVVDGYCFVLVSIREWGWEKHTKYIVEPGFYSGPHPLVMNLKAWNALPKKFKDIFTEAAMEAERKTVAYYEEEGKKEIPLLKQAGLQVIDLPPAEKEKFLKVAYDEGWKDIIQNNPKTGSELQKLLTRKK
jgi:TRAP-type transport system periplasmic protein